MSTESAMPSNHLNLCHPLLLPSIFLSIRCFSYESTLHIRCCKYWSFRFTISPSNEYSGLISFRINRFDLLAVQGTLKRLLSQFSNSVLSDVLWHHGLQHARLACPHQLQELAQTHVHQVGDAIQPFQPLSSPSPPAFNLSQHHSFFQWVNSFHQVAKVLEFQLQHQSFQWIFRTDFLYGLISLQSKGLSRVSSNTTVQKHQFFGAQLSLWYNTHIHTWLLEKP